MTEATASTRGFLSSFEAAIHLQNSPFSFHNKFEICMCCRRGLIVILRRPTKKLVYGKIAVVKRFYKISESLLPSIHSSSPCQVLALCKGIREILTGGIRNPGHWIPEYTAQGIQNPTNDWNP